MKEKIIIECDIHVGKHLNSIWVRYADLDGWACIHVYDPDEVSYDADDFVGMPRWKVISLMSRKEGLQRVKERKHI